MRKIAAATNLVSALAGTGQAGASGNGGPGNAAQLSGPTGVAIDAAGEVYIADTGNGAVRFVNAAGVINTVVGTLGVPGAGTLPSSALTIGLTSPSALVSSGAGRLVILDAGNNRAIVDDRGSVVYNFGRANLGASSANLAIQENSTGSAALTLGANLFTTSGNPSQFSLVGSSTNPCGAGSSLTPGTNCQLVGQFTPTVLGTSTATYTESATNLANAPAPFVTLSGTGATLTQTTSSVAVTSSGSPQYSVPFTVTATIVPASCNPAATPCAPSGTVSFYDEFGIIGSPQTLVQGTMNSTATQSVAGLAVGSHTIYVVYSGDPNYAGSTSTTIAVVVAQGTTTTTVTLQPASGPQYTTAFNFSAQVKSPTTDIPTGTVSFYAGSTLLGSRSLNAQTGIAVLTDTPATNLPTGQPSYYNNYSLLAGTYQVTATYNGSPNYATSTSPASTLTIAGDTQSLTLAPNGVPPGSTTIGTAQGSTAQVNLVVYPSNTFGGTVSFACAGMPTHSDCTFSPTTLTFSAGTGITAPQMTQITFFTDTPAIVASLDAKRNDRVAFATLAGWPMLLSSLFGVFAFRKRLRHTRLLSVLALFGLLAGSAAVLSGCGSSTSNTPSLTPTGVYHVTVTASGPNGITSSFPVTFTVGAGIPGQE